MTDAIQDTIYCANHPQVATSLRCNKCGKPICTRCAVLTPVGYRCRECVRNQQHVFETALWYDYVVAAVIGIPLGAISAALLLRLGFFVFFLAPVAGGVAAEIVRAAVRRRRGRYLVWTAAGAFLLGVLPFILLPLAAILLGGGRGGFGLAISILWPIVYAALSTGTLYARLRGIAL